MPQRIYKIDAQTMLINRKTSSVPKCKNKLTNGVISDHGRILQCCDCTSAPPS
jgi:hypothetical protein